MHKSPLYEEESGKDPVWDLLSKDARYYRNVPSPWFVARTVAQIQSISQVNTSLFALCDLRRWLLPIPLAGLACLIFVTFHGSPTHLSNHGLGQPVSTIASSEEEFEQHMALLAGNDQNSYLDPYSSSP